MKKEWNRESLKGFFRKGQLPSEIHFGYLIDSTVNIIDDGLNKTGEDGLQLTPTGTENAILSVYKAPSEPHPSWQMSLQDNENGTGLSFDSVQENGEGVASSASSLFLAKNGNIGVGTTSPHAQLEINGALGAATRIGTYKIGELPGDGQWHDVISELDGAQAFEVVAGIEGPSGRGKHAITHAIALTTFGKSHHRIQQKRAYFGWFWNRIELRWHVDTRNFSLQIRTRSHYGRKQDGSVCMIRFHVTRLWDISIFQKD